MYSFLSLSVVSIHRTQPFVSTRSENHRMFARVRIGGAQSVRRRRTAIFFFQGAFLRRRRRRFDEQWIGRFRTQTKNRTARPAAGRENILDAS